MSSKVLTLLLSLAAQSGVYARPTGPRAIAEISTALVLLNAPSRAWAFVKYSPGSDNVCGEACEWDAIAYRDEDDNPPSNPPSCGDRITFVINQEGKSALEACAQVAAEFPDICGMCEPIIPTDDWTDEPTPTPTAGPMPAPTIPRDACGEPCKVFTIDAMPYSTDEDGDPDGGCYVVKGTFVDAFNDILQVKSDCAKITVPKDSSVSNIFARFPRAVCPVVQSLP